jgi:hypothetical protein
MAPAEQVVQRKFISELRDSLIVQFPSFWDSASDTRPGYETKPVEAPHPYERCSEVFSRNMAANSIRENADGGLLQRSDKSWVLNLSRPEMLAPSPQRGDAK